MRLAEGSYTNRFQPVGLTRNTFAYMGDQNGIYNRYTATFDSTISYIDTATHYRYFIEFTACNKLRQEYYNHSVANGSDTFGEVLFKNRKFNLRKGSLSGSAKLNPEELENTVFREEKNLALHKADSIEQLRQWLIARKRK